MGVAVLNPQDCLQNPLSFQTTTTTTFTLKKPTRNPNPNGSALTQTQQRNRSKRSTPRPKNPSTSKVEKPAAGDLVMGQVKLLKRGEELTEATTNNRPLQRKVANKDEKRGAPVRGSRNRPGSDSDSKFFAGSFVSIASPPPSSLPIPFFAKKSVVGLRDDEATDGLLKILRLDLVWVGSVIWAAWLVWFRDLLSGSSSFLIFLNGKERPVCTSNC